MTRAYTTIKQSRKLAQILPLESADMYYPVMEDNIPRERASPKDGEYLLGEDIECWSLAALLDVLPDSIYDNTNKYSQLEFSKKSVAYHGMNDRIKIGTIKGNLVDACYEMILKLKELNLL